MNFALRFLDKAMALQGQEIPTNAPVVTALATLSIAAALVGIEEHLGTLARIEQEKWNLDYEHRGRSR